MKGGSLDLLVHNPSWDRARFPVQNQDTKLRRDSILKFQFAPKTPIEVVLTPKEKI
jgi:hypothetical protein